MIKKTRKKIASILAVLAAFLLGIFSFLHITKAESRIAENRIAENRIEDRTLKHTKIPEFIQGRLSPSAYTNAPHILIRALVRKDQEERFVKWLDEHNLKWGLSYKDMVDAAIAFRIEQIQKEISE